MSAIPTAERRKMPKRRAEKPDLVSVKLPADVMDSARIVAAYTGQTMADLLGEILRPILARMEKEEHAKRVKGQGGSK